MTPAATAQAGGSAGGAGSAAVGAKASPYEHDESARAVVARMRALNPKADPLAVLPDVHPSRVPRHIAIIMDGNGRWAAQRGLARIVGHRNGAAAVRRTVEACGRLGVEVLTLYSFSIENWKRPRAEIDALMHLCLLYLEGEREALVRHGIRFRVIGRRRGLPEEVVRAIESVERATADVVGPTLCLAINYGSRAEIADAARALAEKVARGEVRAEEIDESAVEGELSTRGLPDPDLVIRTAGEQRVSNFLLWQISYAELHATPVLWPDFGEADLYRAVRDYAGRRRRFGGLAETGEGAERASD